MGGGEFCNQLKKDRMKIFIICSVRDASADLRDRLEKYTADLEADGHSVHLPHRNTDQTADSISICRQNMRAIELADEVHIFYDPASFGSHFDMGVSFAKGKPIKIVEGVKETKGKSFHNMLAAWQKSV